MGTTQHLRGGGMWDFSAVLEAPGRFTAQLGCIEANQENIR